MVNWQEEMTEIEIEYTDPVDLHIDYRLVLQYDELQIDSAQSINAQSQYSSGMDFVAKHYKRCKEITANLCRYYGQPDLADDMLGDIVTKEINKAFDDFDATRNDSIDGWMFYRLQLAGRDWFRTYREHAARLPLSQLSSDDDNVSSVLDAAAIDKHKREISALLDCDQAISILGSLSAREQQIVRMHCCYDMPFPEIADRLGGAPSTIRVEYNDIMQWLRRQLINTEIEF